MAEPRELTLLELVSDVFINLDELDAVIQNCGYISEHPSTPRKESGPIPPEEAIAGLKEGLRGISMRISEARDRIQPILQMLT